jgi:hypothetical protein
MVIQISVDTTQPLAGTAAAERGAPVPFVGWLELLRAISALVETEAAPGAPAVRCGPNGGCVGLGGPPVGLGGPPVGLGVEE